MDFALKYPEMVNKLILNGGNLYPKGVRFLVQLPIEIGYRIISVISNFSPKAVARKEMLGLMVNDPYIAPEELAQLSMPTLVIVGDKDMIKDEHSRLIARQIPNSVFKTIPGDHFIAGKNPAPFNKAVEEFLNS